VSSKYDPLRRELETAPTEEPVSFTFAELDRLVDGLPASAREHRTWWGNTFANNRPHALAWMTTGRRVMEVRIGEAVVFSPADAPTAAGSGGAPARTRTAPSAVLDGVSSLAAVLRRAGYAEVLEAVAAHTVFLHPDTVAQTRGQAVFRLVRDPTRRGQIDTLPTGERVMFDDNNGPTLAFLWSARRGKGPDVQYNHVWGDPRNVDTYTALWNLCATPAFLAKTTDGSNHPEVVNLLRYRAFDLFGCLPKGEENPTRPQGYEALQWPESPAAVTNLEVLLRQRLADAPRSRPAVSARAIGWIFSGNQPDTSLPPP